MNSEHLCQAIVYTRQTPATSERRTCRVIGLIPSTLQYRAAREGKENEEGPRPYIIRLAVHMAKMATARLASYSGLKAGASTSKGLSVSRVKKACGFQSATKSISASIAGTVPSSGWAALPQPCLFCLPRARKTGQQESL